MILNKRLESKISKFTIYVVFQIMINLPVQTFNYYRNRNKILFVPIKIMSGYHK
jgi:hypothetical protein